MRAVGRSEDSNFSEGVDVGIDVNIGIAAAIENFATVDFPIVKLSAAAIDGIGHTALRSNGSFVLGGLIADPRDEFDERGEIAAVQLQLANLRSGNRTRHFRGLGLNFAGGVAFHDNLAGHFANHQLGVDAKLLSDSKNHLPSFIFFKAGRCDDDVVSAGAEAANKVVTVAVGDSTPAKARGRIAHRNLRPSDRCAGAIDDSAGEGAGGLREETCGKKTNAEQTQY